MEEIIKYINSHDMLSWHGIEVALELTKGTLRAGKGTNPKYIPDIIRILSQYGYGVAERHNTDNVVVAKCETPIVTNVTQDNDKALPYIFKCDIQGFYYMNGQLKTRPKGNDTKTYKIIELD